MLVHHSAYGKNPFVDGPGNTGFLEAMLVEIRQKLRHRVLLAREKFPGVPLNGILTEGIFEDSIVALIREKDAGLLVMGANGASGISRLFGSIATHLIEASPIPVLMVPPSYEAVMVERIVFATTGTDSQEPALAQAIAFARLFKARLTLLHLGAIGDQAGANAFIDYTAEIRNEFRYRDMHFRFQPVRSVTAALKNLQDLEPFDLLCLVRRKKNIIRQLFSANHIKDTVL